MSAKDDRFTMGLDQLNALFAWWGVPNATASGKIDAQMKRFQTLIADLQRAQGEAYSRQMEALFTAGERVAEALREFTHCRQPEDVIAAGSNILATILEGTSLQANTWVELTQKVQDCCAELAREPTGENRNPTNEPSHKTRPVKADDHATQSIKTGDHARRPIKAGIDAPEPAKVA